MHKVLTGLVSAAALVALAACGEADNTTTQSVEPATEEAPIVEPTEDPTLETDTDADTDATAQ